jgi:hypothetical protein
MTVSKASGFLGNGPRAVLHRKTHQQPGAVSVAGLQWVNTTHVT